jgi:hypothetical protein
MPISVLGVECDGLANAGGIDSPTFAKDGGTSSMPSSLGQHPTWASALFVHMARLWQTCWPHSPPLPLVIEYQGRDIDITAEDEEAIILALEQRDRVRRIRFINLPVLQLQKLIMTIDGEYPILGYLILWDPPGEKSAVLILPETLHIPHLRRLAIGFSIPIRSPLLGTPAGLVTLNLVFYHPSAYFQPTVLLQSLSLMPQLEILLVYFYAAVPNRDVERQLMRTPIMTHVTLPNLRLFAFKAVGAYSEAVLSRITASRLEIFQICYPKQLTFSVPELLHFMGRTESFRFDRAEFQFISEQVFVEVNPPETNIPVPVFSIDVGCWHLDWQVSSVAQISNALSQIFSAQSEGRRRDQYGNW